MKFSNTLQEESLSIYEKLTIIGLVFAPFTALRISLIGISELSFIFLCGYSIYQSRGKIKLIYNGISICYLMFIPMCLLGWVWNFLSQTNSGTLNSALFNLFSYIFTAISMIVIENYQRDSDTVFRPIKVLNYFFVYLSALSIFLYVLSMFRSSILGYKLMYHQYFCPMSNNIHQFAMMAVVLPFIGLSLVKMAESKIVKIILIIMILADAYIVSQTGSTKVSMGLIVGGIVLIFILIIDNPSLKKRDRYLVLMLISIAIILFVITNSTFIISCIENFFSENDGHSAREFLYRNAIITIGKSPIVGLGPSIHLMRQSGHSLIDAHETFLSAALSGGVIGALFILFAFLTGIRFALNKSKNPFLFSAMIPIFIYALGGDILRKLGLWVVFLLLAYAGNSSDKNGEFKYE